MYRYSNSLLTKFTFSIKISKYINFLICVVYYRQHFYKIKSFWFLFQTLLNHNNSTIINSVKFSIDFLKNEKSCYLDKSRKRKKGVSQKSSILQYLSRKITGEKSIFFVISIPQNYSRTKPSYFMDFSSFHSSK